MIIAYTDGACKGNGKQGAGAGGWGVHIIYPNGAIHDFWGGESDTTNNRMELLGAIVALENTPSDTPLQLWTDSGYVKDGITKWIDNWQKTGWKTANKQPVKNQDLWQRLDKARQNRQIDWQWLKGHAGHAGNEQADALANLGVTDSGNKFTEAPPTSPKTKRQKSHASSVIRHDQQNPDYDGDTSKVNPHFWAILPDPINKGNPERQLIMDTETTGLEEQKGDRIVEVGIIELVGRKFTGQKLHVYLNPDKEMNEETIKIHGISNEFLTDKPRFADVAQYIYDFMQGAEIIAHNASFDMKFLKMEFDKVGLTDFEQQVSVTDSLIMARQKFPGQKNTLDALVRRLNVGQKDRTFHGALLDSEILAEVYLAMTGGQISLLSLTEETTQNATQEEFNFNFKNLNQYANALLCSPDDTDGDDVWRRQNFT